MLVVPVFIACFIGNMPAVTAQSAGSTKSITDLPLRPHTHPVDIFFNDEKPREPFYKIDIIETRAAPGTSMDALLLQLKKAAQAEGIDGILLGDPGKQAANVVTYPNNGGFSSYQVLAGIGIRYRRTIDYMDTILMEQSVSLWSDDNTDPKQFSMKYDFYGKNLSLGDDFIYKFFDEQVYPYEDGGSPVTPFGDWQCKYDGGDHIFSRKKMVGGFMRSNSQFYYEAGRFTKADIVFLPTGFEKKTRYQIEPVYNAVGLLTGRRLMNGKSMVWEEAISYRLNGMPDKVSRFKVSNGQRTPLFEIKSTYYSDTILPAPEH
ncbi:MAG TPA: hypothetical protein VLD19_15115 [Chitinophagaceae bacterium]|nr:hypothetical protein [Chitinophagaceae bacterium]